MDTKILAAQLLASERAVASAYNVLDPPSGSPPPDDLRKLHLQLDTEIAKLVAFVRTQTESDKLAVRVEHVRAHRAIKVVGGDLFLIELETARADDAKTDIANALAAAKSNAPPPDTTTTDAQSKVRAAFESFLQRWLAASPLIHPETADKLWPKIKNAKDFGSARSLSELSSIDPTGKTPPPPKAPIELARDAIRRELRQVVVNPSTPALSDDTVHLVGTAYLLAQVELAMRFQNDQSYERFVSGWYEAAKRPMDAMFEMVGCLDRQILEAIRDGDPFGLERLTRSRSDILATLALYYSVPDWQCATLAGFVRPNLPTDVVGVNAKTEKTTARDKIVHRDKTLTNDTKSKVPEEMLGYLADTGFPLIYPWRGNAPRDAPVDRFGRAAARAIVQVGKRERAEQLLQVRFSVSETITAQQELIADLLDLLYVRDAFAKELKKAPRINLIDRTIRGRAFAAAWRTLSEHGEPDVALIEMVDLVRRYLQAFTRHTGDNMRDNGKPYLETEWPLDLSGRQFHDCGIYAVETAFDFMRIANAMRGTTFTFRFLLIPEHVALVIYHGDTSFCVNNADISNPVAFSRATAAKTAITAVSTDPEHNAGLAWASVVTQPLYDARFAILVAAITPKALSSQRATGFASDIWKQYKLLDFGVDGAVREKFFTATSAFTAGCALLCAHLIELQGIERTGATNDQLIQSLDAATTLTDQLYQTIELLADPNIYSNPSGLGLVSTIVGHVSIDDKLVQRAKLGSQLPVYRFIQFLKQSVAQPNAAQQKLIGLKTDGGHLGDLNSKFTGRSVGKADYRALNSRLDAAAGEILKLIKSDQRVAALV